MTDAPLTTDLRTPGPWTVEDPLDFELSIVEASKPSHEWKFIASISMNGEKEGDFPKAVAEANARLIAAAPELLAILRKLAGECAECEGSGESGHTHSDGTQYSTSDPPCPDCADIRAVINKAEGKL